MLKTVFMIFGVVVCFSVLIGGVLPTMVSSSNSLLVVGAFCIILLFVISCGCYVYKLVKNNRKRVKK